MKRRRPEPSVRPLKPSELPAIRGGASDEPGDSLKVPAHIEIPN